MNNINATYLLVYIVDYTCKGRAARKGVRACVDISDLHHCGAASCTQY